MRLVVVGDANPLPEMFSHPEHYFSIMTVHPIVGIFGSTYQLVFAAFMFLVPYLTKKPLYSVKLANYVWLAITIGTALALDICFCMAVCSTIYTILATSSRYKAV